MSPVRSAAGPLDLLRQLGSGVRPGGVSGGSSTGAPALDRASFEDLLALARDGKVDAGAPLTFGRDVPRDLSAVALEALSLATSAAEAQGATRLGAQVEGRVVTIDVLRREVVSVEPARPNAVFTGVDAFVALDGSNAGSGEGSGAGPRLAYPGSLPANQAVSRIAQQRAG